MPCTPRTSGELFYIRESCLLAVSADPIARAAVLPNEHPSASRIPNGRPYSHAETRFPSIVPCLTVRNRRRHSPWSVSKQVVCPRANACQLLPSRYQVN